MNYVVIILIGALASILANRGIAVFNDGFRPIIPQYFDGMINRKELATLGFAISFGLVIGFGIPTSIAATIILIHCLLLTTDIIGVWCPDNMKGTVIAGVIGGIYGLLILVGLEVLVNLFGYLPYNFLGNLGTVSSFVTVAFAIFPAVAITYQHGLKKGSIAGSVTVLMYFLIKRFGTFSMGEYSVTLSAEGLSMLVGTVLMIIFAAQVKGDGNANASLTEVFSEKLARIRKNWPILAVMGGLIACATSLAIVAGDPISLALLAEGSYGEATIAALARAIGFVPLVFTTAIVTGVYAPAGCTFVFVIGLAFHGNPIVAFILGAVVIVVELLFINIFAKGMDRFPGVKEMGEHIRTSMNKVLELALLVGAVTAAEAMAKGAAGLSGVGAMFVLGCVLLNRKAKKPIVELAIGPVACITFGILLNILVALGICVIPV